MCYFGQKTCNQSIFLKNIQIVSFAQFVSQFLGKKNKTIVFSGCVSVEEAMKKVGMYLTLLIILIVFVPESFFLENIDFTKMKRIDMIGNARI
jgi:hypothetical protein